MGIEARVREGKLLRENKEFFKEQIEKDKPYIEKFCNEQTERSGKRVKLLVRDLTDENNLFELMYYFSNKPEGYLIEEIKNSLGR